MSERRDGAWAPGGPPAGAPLSAPFPAPSSAPSFPSDHPLSNASGPIPDPTASAAAPEIGADHVLAADPPSRIDRKYARALAERPSRGALRAWLDRVKRKLAELPDRAARGAGAPVAPAMDPDRARAILLRRKARAQAHGLPLQSLVAAATFFIALQLLPLSLAAPILAPMLLAEALERVGLRAMARWSEARRARRSSAWLALGLAALNGAAVGTSLFLLWRYGGPAATSLASASALCLSISVALAHASLPMANLVRQAPMMAAFLAVWIAELISEAPDPSPAARAGAAGAVMLTVLMALAYRHLHRVVLRRARAQRELSRARQEAERRSTALAAVRDEAERAALHDALTGLPNRRYLDRRLAQLSAELEGRGVPVGQRFLAVMLVDLDRFKAINDTLGHDAGDHVLRRMAEILRESVRDEDFVARNGGDEFVILALTGDVRDTAEAIARRIIDAAREPLRYDDQPCRIGATVGIAVAPRAAARPQRMLADADIALYRAKAQGRGRAEFFSEGLQREATAARRRADDLMRGLETGEILPFYALQVRVSDRSLYAAEATPVWRHPVRGLLPWTAFRDAAAEAGVVSEVESRLLASLLADRRALLARGLTPPPLAAPISPARVTDPALAAQLMAEDLPPGALTLVLSESPERRDEAETLRWTMERLSHHGVEAGLAALGGARVTLGALTALRPRRMKLDRSFTRRVCESQEWRGLLRAVTDMASALDIEVVAEGVEREAQAEMVRDLGCAAMQGPILAAPLSAVDFADWLASRAVPAEKERYSAAAGVSGAAATLSGTRPAKPLDAPVSGLP